MAMILNPKPATLFLKSKNQTMRNQGFLGGLPGLSPCDVVGWYPAPGGL